MSQSKALIIFAKYPMPGKVKSRLSPPLTAEEGAECYSCMLRDTLSMTKLLPDVTTLIFFQNDAGAADFFQEIAPGIESLEQVGLDLGERMKNAFELMFARGFSEVAIIGSDSPDLPTDYILQAFNLMEYEHTDGVLGAAGDGGYYLIAMKRVWPELFDSIPWSSGEVLRITIERAANAYIGMALLPEWHDIDTYEDLSRPGLLDKSNPALLTREFISKQLLNQDI